MPATWIEATAAAPAAASERWEQRARRAADSYATGWRAAAAMAVLASLPVALGFVPPQGVAITVAFGLTAWLLARREARTDRSLFVLLFLVSYAARLAALMGVAGYLNGTGGPVLSGDGNAYWYFARMVAAGKVHYDSSAIQAIGSYDVGAYLLFGTVLRLFPANFFALQLVNSAFMSLVAPLAYSWFRRLVPAYALAIAAVIALHPSLIYLSSVNLLKDPSGVACSVLVAWAFAGVLMSRHWRARLVHGAIAVAPLLYLRVTRFYVAAFLVVAFLGGTAIAWVWAEIARAARNRPDNDWLRRVAPAWNAVAHDRRRVLVGLLAVLALSGLVEALVVDAGWPFMPRQVIDQVRYVRETETMRRYGAGMLDASLPGARVLIAVANGFRRLYGPFVWIPPERWNVREMLGEDFFLYPGTLFWYAVLPFLAAGLASVCSRIVRGLDTRPDVIAVFLFSAAYLAQFLMINLSHRQRDDLLPFLLPFACWGWMRASASPRWRRVYAAYWVLLAVIAAGHLLLRAHVAR